MRRWASETFAQPGRRGRQHWVQHMTFEGTADGVAVRSYWKVVQGLASTNTGAPSAMGRCLIKEKRIYRCNDETPPPWRARRCSQAQAVATRRGAFRSRLLAALMAASG